MQHPLQSHTRLTRSRDGLVAGVAAGLAQRYGLPVWGVRLAWLAAMLVFGTGFLLYAVLWWLMPHEDRLPIEPAIWRRGSGGYHPPLVRTDVDRKLLGVCGGLARRWGFDPTLVRLATLSLMSLSMGLVVVAYFVGALIIPGPEARISSSSPIEL